MKKASSAEVCEVIQGNRLLFNNVFKLLTNIYVHHS